MSDSSIRSSTNIDLRRLRVDQVGGLAAPRSLWRSFELHERGEITEDAWQSATDAAVRAVLKKQEAIGFPILSDGELRRRNFQQGFTRSVSGYHAPEEARDTGRNCAPPGHGRFERRRVKRRLGLVRNVPLEEYVFASRSTKMPVKVGVLSPDRILQRYDRENSLGVYGDTEAFLADVVTIQREVIRALIEAGCRYIQIDAPNYTAYVDPESEDSGRSRGEDPAKNLERAITADNAIIEGFDGVTFGLHVCRGNIRAVDPQTGKMSAGWLREGAYDSIAERLFTGLEHHRLLLEYDSERAGDFAPLRFIPKDKIAVLGLVTSKNPTTESKDTLLRRIDDASCYLSIDQLALSPQCGFGGLEPLLIAPAAQWRKFERILETANAVWGET